jgi:hypothetical protein
MRSIGLYGARAALGLLLGLVAAPEVAMGQGCMPLRFTSPSLGGEHVTYLEAHAWQLGMAARRVATHRFFVGTQEDETRAPGGQPLYLRLNSLDLSLTYATSERLSLTLTVPLSYSTASNVNPDQNRYHLSSRGVGDLNLMGNLWLRTPGAHPDGNIVFGLGLKSPTGSNHVMGDFGTPSGTVIQQAVPQTIQLGDGGWAVLLQTQAFQRIVRSASVYVSGFYSVSLRQHTDVLWPPANALLAVPDLYSARLGFAYGLKAEPAVSVSLGGRMDGTTRRDLIGGRTDYYRHSGYTMYVDPGLSYQMGREQLNLNVPVRVRHNYLSQQLSNGTVRPGTGGVGDFVIFVSWTHRI